MRVIQVGLGPVGIALAKLVTTRPGLELVGAVDPRPELTGRDLGEIIGHAPLGLPVSSEAAALLERAQPEVVIHATGSFLAGVAAQLRTALDSGASVVSTCEELAYPFYRHPSLARELDAYASDRGAVLLGTGINPGFVMDKLAITLCGACRSVRSVRVRRVVDAATRREPLQRKIGAGLSVHQFEAMRRAGPLGHVGLVESAHMIADAVGVPAERTVRDELRPVIAAQKGATGFLSVEPGQVAGIDQKAWIEAGGRERVRLEIQMSVGAERSFDAISIEGSPGIEMEITNGLHGDEGTAAVVVNCAYLLRDLRPGLRTMLDVPLRGFEQGPS